MAKKVNDKGAIAAPVGFKVTDDGKAIRAMTDTVIKVSNKLSDDLHKLLISLCMHATLHGDVSEATRLVLALDKGASHRATSIIKWLMAYGPFVWSKSKGANNKTEFKFNLNKTTRAQYQDELKNKSKFIQVRDAEPFWVFDPPKEFKGFDLMAMIERAIKQGESYQEGGEKYESLTDEQRAKVNVKGLAAIKAALAKVA